MTKCEFEYRPLSIQDKLKFDPSGRPGATAVRADQKRLRTKKSDLHIKTKHNLVGRPAHYTPFFGRVKRESYYEEQHKNRKGRADAFLREIEARKKDIAEGSPLELFGLSGAFKPEGGFGIETLGRGWFFRKEETVSYDNNYYSKTWHRNNGPKKTIEARTVTFKRLGPRSRKPQSITVNLESWAGDWLGRAVIMAKLAPKKHHETKSIRLSDVYDAKLITVKRGYKIYERTLLGATKGYAIRSPLGMIYHAKSRSALISGLHNKIRAKAKKLKGPVDWKMLKTLGFCSDGITAFCDTYGFDAKGNYPAEEIEFKIRANPEKMIFWDEVKTLAKALNHHVPEFN